MKRPQFRFFIIIGAMVFLLAACGPAPTAETITVIETVVVEVEKEVEPEPADERGTLRVAHNVQAYGGASFDPGSPQRFLWALHTLYERLVREDENGSAAPDLAVSWEADATATSWTFKLREGVTFHDGRPFTSADVAYTFRHYFDPELESPVAAVLDIID